MKDSFRTLIVPAEISEKCRTLAARWPGGIGMFTVPLYTGKNITHYISTGYIKTEVAEILDNPEAFAEATGIPQEEAELLRSQIHISTRQDVHTELSELGLSLKPTE